MDFMNIIKKLPRLFLINILWFVCCIPVLTAGASTCAAFAVTLRIADDDEEVRSAGGIIRRFFKAFRQDLLQGFLILLFTAAGSALGGLFIYLAYDSGFNLIKIAAILGYFLVFFVFIIYSYPLIARYSNSFVNTLRNSVALFAQYPNQSVKTLVIVIVEGVLLYLTRYVFFTGLIILPSLIFYTVSVTAKDIFVKLENPPAHEEDTESEAEQASELEADSEES